MKIIAFILRFAGRQVFLAASVGIVAGFASAGLMALINYKLSRASAPLDHLWLFGGFVLATLLSSIGSRFMLINLAHDVPFELRMQLCRQVLNVPLRQLEETGAHRVHAALNHDIPIVMTGFLDFPVFCINLATTLGCLVYLCWLSPMVFVAFIIVLLLTIGILELVQKKANQYIKQAREDYERMNGYFHSLTDGAKELKLHRGRRIAFFSELLRPTARAFRDHSRVGRQLLGINATGSQVLYFIFIGVLLFMLPSFWEISRETLTAYTLTALFLRTPVTLVVDTIPSFAAANIALKKIDALGLSLASTNVKDETTHAIAPKSWKRIELAGVTHQYQHELSDYSFTLGPINLTFEPGELVFLVGGNGSGKTSFAKLLTGLYIPEAGEIRLNGKPVLDEHRDSYRQLFSVVFSTPYLFDHLLGMDVRNLDARTSGYLDKLQLSHKVHVKDGVLSTTELSQGQRKRLALLTAYLEDRPFYVFDEWAADQDPLFKEFFYLQLLPELRAIGKTVLVISHDDRYYHTADRIIKLESGQVVFNEVNASSAAACDSGELLATAVTASSEQVQ
ncbi:MAG TPA: cyclic peptide export ABC transporter [Pyrinomonadaceae bacterium]|jgi:putative ATP-binding cassette transporter